MPVTMDALVQRINRKLKPDGETLKKTRGERWRGDLGDYFAVDCQKNFIKAQHVDPEVWGREMGVLKPFERVVVEG